MTNLLQAHQPAQRPQVPVSAGEWWEAQKRAADVTNAKLALVLAEQTQAMFYQGLLQRRGLPPGDYDLTPEEPQPPPRDGGGQ